jgi:Membrane-associated lipoprotein involved in thiamine biosynthesis
MHQFTWRAMGTEFTLYLPDGEREWAAGVAGELQEETRRLERQLSLYLLDSDLCYLNAHAHEQPIRVEPELFRLLQTCQSLYALTQGAFDPTVTPLLRLWGFVDKQYRVPDPPAIEQALERVGMELVLLEPSGCWVYYALPGVELSFGAIGKGWAIAQCVRILRELGVANALLDAGGSTLYALGTPEKSVALTPSPSPTGWERGVGAHGGAPCSAFPLSRLRERGTKLIRVHRLGSLWAGGAHFLPSPPAPLPRCGRGV